MPEPSDPVRIDAVEQEAASAEQVEQELERFEESKLGRRHLHGPIGWILGGIAVVWSLFQLALPQLPGAWMPTSEQVRAIHLAFAIGLVYLTFPMFRRLRMPRWLSFLSAKRRLPWFDAVLAGLASVSALYLILDYEGISSRLGRELLWRDMAFGVALIVLLLEAARRAFGPALSIVAAAFMCMTLFAERLPGVLATKSVSPGELINKLTMGTTGVYGVPLSVSANTVFLFVLFGALLEASGGGRYFVDLAFSLLGRYRGGPAKAAVCASGLTGMISGSSIANVVTTGTFTIPLMKEAGYPPTKAAAIEVAASTNGQLMPPIMGAAAFIIAEYCSLPYLEVVRAAFIPAVVSYLALIYLTHLEACKLGLRGIPADRLPRFVTVLLSGVHFLVPLAALVTMLLRGFSPQVAVFWAIVSLAALVLLHGAAASAWAGHGVMRGLRTAVRMVAKGLIGGGVNMMAVAVACATAGIIVGSVGLGFGGKITEIVATASGGSFALVLVLTAIASLLLGMGLPTTATYIVMASLIANVIVDLGADSGILVAPIAAHLFCFFFGILADDTPPVGLAAYAGAAIARSNPIRTGVQGFWYDLRTALLPFMFVLNPDLLLLDVHAWWHIGLVFVAATVALMGFAALTQNFMVTRNRIWETALLLVGTTMLLWPQFPKRLMARTVEADSFVTSRFTWYAVGMAIVGGVYLLQRLRTRRRAA